MPALRREVLKEKLGREPGASLLENTQPHQRGFGTAGRFHSSSATITPGPFTMAQELQLVGGFTPLKVSIQLILLILLDTSIERRH